MLKRYRIKLDAPGALFVMARPAADHLHETLTSLKRGGIGRVVSLLSGDETRELKLGEEGALCAELGLAFTSFPIADYDIPEPAGFSSLIGAVKNDLDAGVNLAVHCKAGIGRSGTLACCILKTYGFDSDEAIACASHARGVAVPDNVRQIDFIQRFEPVV